MFSTIDGAKKRAQALSRVFADSGIVYPLHKCQEAVARAGGFETWFQLYQILSKAPRDCDPKQFTVRLMRYLPFPCRQPALAWLERTPRERFDGNGQPPYWIHDVVHYVLSSARAHRAGTALIRSGSGAGQKLREELVWHLLLNVHQIHYPSLEPEACALIFSGKLSEIFGKATAHPRFQTEFDTLVKAGIFTWTPGRMETGPGTLTLFPPPGDDLADDVTDSHGGKVAQWFEEPEYRRSAIGALTEALASLGVMKAQEIAEAVVSQGAPGYTSPSGPVLTLLTKQVDNSDLEAFAHTVALFAAVHPKQANSVRNSVPSKIAQYLARHPRLNTQQLLTWERAHPEWKDELILASRTPSKFEMRVDRLVAQILAEAA